jgi:hypothetical protein
MDAPIGSATVTAFWSGTALELLATPARRVVAELARHQVRHFRTTETEPSPAWEESVAALQTALASLGALAAGWHVLFEYPMLRLGMRIDAVLLTDRAILVLEFKRAQADLAALRQVEDYALNLRDFHDGSRTHPIVPVLVSGGAIEGRNQVPLFWDIVPSVPQQIRPEDIATFIANLMAQIGPPASALDPALWLGGAYRPVPTIIEAARMVYAKHGVAEIAAARADQKNLHETTDAIWAAVNMARVSRDKIVLFVTGIPGAGKTLCGLNIAFGGDDPDGTFLTGNPTLVHVLREALVRDAVDQGTSPREAKRRMLSKIQALPHFRNDNLQQRDRPPPERIAVIDEAQRCWSRDYAIRKTRDKGDLALTDSEPGHLLDIMARHDGFSALVCLVGSGQEIHDGEGGLAEWGFALAGRPNWQVMAPPDALNASDPRWRLGDVPNPVRNALLHLDVAVRQIRSVEAVAWVDALLAGHTAEALANTQRREVLPFLLTRSLAAARTGARAFARGNRRAGMLASSGGRRLRAEGLGAELPHMDAAAVAHWFLDSFPPDVRAADALEQIATEFSCQGLELDVCLLCWDADLIPATVGAGWVPRNFRGTRWQAMRGTEAIANQLNTYRVLLTRARYETIIFVPPGDARDVTRDPAVYDRIAARLHDAGVPWLDESSLHTDPATESQRTLL